MTMVRARWLAGALALVLAIGLPAAASAADYTPISGRVVPPPGWTAANTRVEAHFLRSDGTAASGDHTTVREDGTFTVPYIYSGTYGLFFSCSNCGLVEGYYAGPGRPLVTLPSEALAVPGGAEGIEIAPSEGIEITGQLTLPPGLLEDSWWSVYVQPYEVGTDGTLYRRQGHSVYERSHGSFTLRGMRPGATYVLRVHSGGYPTYPGGYYHAGAAGLVESPDLATPVRPGSHVKIVATGTGTPALSSVATPTVQGRADVGSTLRASEGEWSLRGVELAFQWLRDGSAIPGETAAHYEVQPADVGSRLAVKVSAARSGFPTASATSASTAPVALQAAPRATKAPAINGTARLGATLSASSGTWDLSGADLSFQWVRGGKAIAGATSARYRLTKADVGAQVAVRVTARVAGHAEGSASSSALKVAKGKPSVRVKVRPVKAGKRAKLAVTVKVAGFAKPAGRLTVKYGSRSFQAKLAAKRKGKVTLRLPVLARGKHKIVVRFTPAGSSAKYLTKARSKKGTLRVR